MVKPQSAVVLFIVNNCQFFKFLSTMARYVYEFAIWPASDQCPLLRPPLLLEWFGTNWVHFAQLWVQLNHTLGERSSLFWDVWLAVCRNLLVSSARHHRHSMETPDWMVSVVTPQSLMSIFFFDSFDLLFSLPYFYNWLSIPKTLFHTVLN